ncbi:hypothetical protein B0H11DRAFT_2188704 [Mycena galericulata]|nr:hypothetical protein B0H11DRAFT_2188704 [Mycena galericulata]
MPYQGSNSPDPCSACWFKNQVGVSANFNRRSRAFDRRRMSRKGWSIHAEYGWSEDGSIKSIPFRTPRTRGIQSGLWAERGTGREKAEAGIAPANVAYFYPDVNVLADGEEENAIVENGKTEISWDGERVSVRVCKSGAAVGDEWIRCRVGERKTISVEGQSEEPQITMEDSLDRRSAEVKEIWERLAQVNKSDSDGGVLFKCGRGVEPEEIPSIDANRVENPKKKRQGVKGRHVVYKTVTAPRDPAIATPSNPAQKTTGYIGIEPRARH